MAVGPPFDRAPSGWMLDGAFLSTRTPDTRRLLPLFVLPDDDPVSGMATVMEFCTLTSLPQLYAAILRPRADGPAPTLELLQFVADRLVESHLGVKRWIAQRVWRDALGSWLLVDGELQLRGIDVLALPPDRATNAVYALLRGWAANDQASLDKWKRRVETPPLREIRRWKRDDVAVSSGATAADMAERVRKMKESQRARAAAKPVGATITMPSSDTLTPDDQRSLPAR
ncbi:hypothetical protein SEA_VERITY_31 [Gordonia phage Verity]|uniref:Tail assembly chaperone n=1 Tax=Gordonia phage Verity TaxID=2591211 RepID=A0A514DIU4_9CAUD|nr:hypothetical protein J1776_gp31 [Gordonia phage Verity]QDH93517.1 hypothetical protein SEA_VERITY_31 [Gordonia phage Verity]QPO16874.1 hypothetical protein SEA_DELREY21_31 [Gordonia phage Delrey21]QXN74157.1 hypothetical protein SEA_DOCTORFROGGO_31 [Gordonia phage DoctorFroggo]